jgi:hypothetical protein
VPLAAAERNAFRNRPAGQGAVALEPEVVVQPARSVPLNHETGPISGRGVPERFGSSVRLPAPPVLVEAHLWIVARNATLPSPSGCITLFLPAQDPFVNRG